jgi:hypothetical protein
MFGFLFFTGALMVWVVKRSGEREDFDRGKVEHALRRSGASESLAKDVAFEVEKKAFDGITTQSLYKLAYDLLGRHDRGSATRFGLKAAIMRLGPTGYPFERYVGRLLKVHGYDTRINAILNGVCVEHEVDVVAVKDGMNYMVECKYHNQQGYSTGLKEALYTQARFQDLVEAGNDFSVPWIFCNTKITNTAIDYGRNRGMRFTSWGYPRGESLQDLIECESLYPITIFGTLTEDMRNRLLKGDIVFARDLRGMTPKALSNAVGKPMEKIRGLIEELDSI